MGYLGERGLASNHIGLLHELNDFAENIVRDIPTEEL
jgi:hypothetical protein